MSQIHPTHASTTAPINDPQPCPICGRFYCDGRWCSAAVSSWPDWPTYPKSRRIPHTCPVCGGRGMVPAGFYDSSPGSIGGAVSLAPERCCTCEGKGIVWEGVDA